MLTLGQMALGVIDVCSASATLYFLLPKGSTIGYPTFATLYSFAAMLGIASHSPGGLGVFEATILQGVGGDSDALLASLLAFPRHLLCRSLHRRDGAARRRRGDPTLAIDPRSHVGAVRRLAIPAMSDAEAVKLENADPLPVRGQDRRGHARAGGDRRAGRPGGRGQPAGAQPPAGAQGGRAIRPRPARARRRRRAAAGHGQRRGRTGAVERARARRTAV